MLASEEAVEDHSAGGVARLAEPARNALLSFGARASWPAGFAVYQRGAAADGLFVVLRGCVVLRSRVRAGRGFVPWLAAPGETFGAEGLAPHAQYVTDARADVETETLYLSGQRFRSLVREQPQHALSLMGQVMAERAALLEKLRELTTLNVEQRLITALLRLVQIDAFVPDEGGMLLLPHRYRLLCELVGATRESVSVVLSRLGAEGLVERKGSTLVIGKVSGLEARLDSQPADGNLPFASFSDGEEATEQTIQ